MNLQDLASIAEIAGGFAVLATLIYLVIELRNNTKTTRAQMHEQATQSFLTLLNSIMLKPDVLAAGIKASEEEFSTFSDGDKAYIYACNFGFFKHYELLYVQHQKGLMDEETWTAWQEHLLMYFHQPGIQTWWKTRKSTFTASFQTFLENSEAPAFRSLVDILKS